MRSTIIFAIVFLATGVRCNHLTQVVQTDKGPVQGITTKTLFNDREYSAFLGIPFAKPPVDDRRFKDPEEVDPWIKVLNATSQAPPCAQGYFTGPVGKEDCLYLNVYVPGGGSSGGGDLKPVLFWIYGGAFVSGVSFQDTYGPDWFIEEDIIMVATNYRLGALGFLSLGLPDASGNQGLKDQNMAMQWVQKNIANFGGDPNRVTIMGESAGACSVMNHIASPMSADLFSQAIIQSGSALAPWSFRTPAQSLAIGFTFGTMLGIVTPSNEDLLKRLKQVDIADIVMATLEMTAAGALTPIMMPWAPTYETNTDNDFLDNCPLSFMESGDYNQVPILMGYNKNESLLFGIMIEAMRAELIAGLDTLDRLTFGATKLFSKMLGKMANDTEAEILKIADLYLFTAPADLAQRILQRNNSGNPIYYYRLSYDTEHNFHRFIEPSTGGTAHLDDLPLLLPMYIIQPTDPQDPYNVYSKRLVTLWSNFIKHGNPSPGKNASSDTTWTRSGDQGLQIDFGNEDFVMHDRLMSPEDEEYEKAFYSILPVLQGCLNSTDSNDGKNKKTKNEGPNEKKNEGPNEKKNEDPNEKKHEGPTEKKHEGPNEKKNEGPNEKKNEGPNEKKNEGPNEKMNEGPNEKKNEGPNEKKNEGPNEKKHEGPTEKKHEAPVDKKHEAPTEKKYEAPTEKKHESPTEKKHEAPTEKKHEAPTEKKHEGPTEKKHEGPTEKKHEFEKKQEYDKKNEYEKKQDYLYQLRHTCHVFNIQLGAEMRRTFFFAVVFLVTGTLCLELTGVVQTDKGPIQGRKMETAFNKVKYSAFLGIPFAKPPVGDLRFRDPVEADPWNDVVNATQDGPVCIQSFIIGPYGKEDCLYLNVYTPVTDFSSGGKLKPVLFWIYGGAFTLGMGTKAVYGPDWFLEDDIVVVTVAYRLGVLGFMSLGVPEASGNQGLKDQNLGMQWVQKNIEKFGGDPNRVTIMGESAGACSVLHHMASPMSKGLFHQAIAESGSSLVPWGYKSPTDALMVAKSFGAFVGYPSLTGKALVEKLQKMDAIELVKASGKWAFIGAMSPLILPWAPTYECNSDNPFLTNCPLSYLKSGNYSRVPVLMGYNKEEAVLFAPVVEVLRQVLSSKLHAINRLSLNAAWPFTQMLDMCANSTEQQLIELADGLLFQAPIDLTQRLLVKHNGDKPVYFYQFSYNTNRNIHRMIAPRLDGAAHTDELPLLFRMGIMNPADPDDPYNVYSKRFVSLWTHFIKYGNPTHSENKVSKADWKPSGENGLQIDIGNEVFEMHDRLMNEDGKKFQGIYAAALPFLTGCKDANDTSLNVNTNNVDL
ncbi:uncharacterized protein LOC128885013 [Hylaeus volcanicus]|uniref:uncharacterized protein LOC128885013 n=1 Tax=Hylaeus volcanicus TaxID=313075 RepID=UPI0023B7BE47|nr:uncharacterized protein LOC128885013 [Hylaeus volcanicus]